MGEQSMLDRSKQRISRGEAKVAGVVGFAAAVALPVVLWHHSMGVLAAGFRPTPAYFVAGVAPFGLIALGLLFFVPVVYSIGLSSYAPAYPRRRNAYAGWGVTLYLLGVALAAQVAEITHSLTPH
jgi:hypothetical protein